MALGQDRLGGGEIPFKSPLSPDGALGPLGKLGRMGVLGCLGARFHLHHIPDRMWRLFVPREVELKIRIPEKLFAQLEEYKFNGRFRSRKAAVVSILTLAFEKEAAREPGFFDSPRPRNPEAGA